MTFNQCLLPVFALSLSALTATSVHGHTRWNAEGLTPPRNNADNIKSGPCGAARTDRPAVLEAGATVTVEYESTIFHQGDFRIAFSEANDEGFDEHVLLEGIIDYADQRYRSQEITLPDVECDQCTLQLIQVMRDRSPPTNYYSCADITLTRSSAEDATPPSGITNLAALPGDGQAILSWSNPSDNDFAGVLALRQSTPVTAAPNDGQMYAPGEAIGDAEVIYIGSGDNKVAKDLTHGSTTHFAVFAYDHSFNYSVAVRTAVDVPTQTPNFAPTVMLQWEQERNNTGKADTSGSSGRVFVQALVTDDNPGDSHSFTWSSTNMALIDGDDIAEQFTFDPKGLESGLYEIKVNVTDNGEPPLSTTASVFIELTPQPRGGGGSTHWLALLGLGLMWARRRVYSA